MQRESERERERHQLALALWPHPYPHKGGAYKNSCPLHLKKKLPTTTIPPTPPHPLVVFQLNEIIFPPSGNPVWVRGPAFSLLLIVPSEEEVKHTIRHRWRSLPGNVLILSRGSTVPFLFLSSKCLSNLEPVWNRFVFVWSCVIFQKGSSFGQGTWGLCGLIHWF